MEVKAQTCVFRLKQIGTSYVKLAVKLSLSSSLTDPKYLH